MNTDELSGIYTLLKKSYFASKEFRVFPKDGKAVAHLTDCADIKGEEKKIFLKLPALIRSYLKVGAFVCGEPAVDHEFGSVDFFMCLDVKCASGPYLKRFRIQDMTTR
jgi:putative hemolysin